MIKKIILLITFNFIVSLSHAGETPQDACKQYYEIMGTIPHMTLHHYEKKKFRSFDNKSYDGCEVELETKWSLVGENFRTSSVLQLPGWNQGTFIADGPGSSIYEMVNTNLFCMVGFKFLSYFDEKANRLVTGDELSMYANCAKKYD